MHRKSGPYFYLYGISGNRKEKMVKIAAAGVDGSAAVESVAAGKLTAWYSRVNAIEFGPELAQKLDDIEWVAAAGVRHQKVVAEIARQVSIIPARLGSVFVLRENLTRDVLSRASETQQLLTKIADAEEWGVKVLRRKQPASRAAVKAASGVEYLRRKAALKAERESGISNEVIDFANELTSHAVAAAAVGKLSSAQRDLEWQAAFLIKKKKKAEWDAVVRRYAAQWAETRQIECTGPWAPYSFV